MTKHTVAILEDDPELQALLERGLTEEGFRPTVVSTGAVGLYTSLFYDAGNRPNIFYFKKTNNTAYRAKRTGSTWGVRSHSSVSIALAWPASTWTRCASSK